MFSALPKGISHVFLKLSKHDVSWSMEEADSHMEKKKKCIKLFYYESFKDFAVWWVTLLFEGLDVTRKMC